MGKQDKLKLTKKQMEVLTEAELGQLCIYSRGYEGNFTTRIFVINILIFTVERNNC